MPTGTPVTTLTEPDVEYTDIDLNSTGATTIYDGDAQAAIYGVYLRNGGGTAEVRLEVTDGTDTATIANPSGAGASLEFTGPIVLNRTEDLQINVTTAEGSAQTNTAAVSRDEQ